MEGPRTQAVPVTSLLTVARGPSFSPPTGPIVLEGAASRGWPAAVRGAAFGVARPGPAPVWTLSMAGAGHAPGSARRGWVLGPRASTDCLFGAIRPCDGPVSRGRVLDFPRFPRAPGRRPERYLRLGRTPATAPGPARMINPVTRGVALDSALRDGPQATVLAALSEITWRRVRADLRFNGDGPVVCLGGAIRT
jgi:hypothetical protein